MRLFVTLLTLGLTISPAARAGEAGREFITSCTYGTLAGTLVGAASLAFTKHPGNSLNQVARGASLGLYTGILLGAYVAWVVPRLGRSDDDLRAAAVNPPLVIWPILAANGVDGVEAEVRVLSF